MGHAETFRRRGAFSVFEAGAPLSIILIVSAVPGLIAYTQWSEVEALRHEWTVPGPACQQVETPASWAVSKRKPPKEFEYRGIHFERSFAAVSCAAVPERGLLTRANYAVCQFNNPGLVRVSAAGRNYAFQPPAGHRATVTVRESEVSCVVGGRFAY